MEYKQYLCNEKRHNRYDNIVPSGEKKIKDIKSNFLYYSTHICQKYKIINDEEVFFAVIQEHISQYNNQLRIIKLGEKTPFQSNLITQESSIYSYTGDLCLSNDYNIYLIGAKIYKIGNDLSILNSCQLYGNRTYGQIANKNDYFYFSRADSYGTGMRYITRYDAVNNNFIQLLLDQDQSDYTPSNLIAINNNGKVGFTTLSTFNIVDEDLTNKIRIDVSHLFNNILFCLNNNFLIAFYDSNYINYCALYDENGNLLWSVPINKGAPCCVDSNNNIYVADLDKIILLDGSSGETINELDIPDVDGKTMNINNNSNFYYFQNENNNRRYRSYNFYSDSPLLIDDITFEKKENWDSETTPYPFSGVSFLVNPNWFITQQNHILSIRSYYDSGSSKNKYEFILYKLEPAPKSKGFFPFIWWYWWNENCGEEYDKNVYHETYKGKDPKRGI